jgi:hypothetical protein
VPWPQSKLIPGPPFAALSLRTSTGIPISSPVKYSPRQSLMTGVAVDQGVDVGTDVGVEVGADVGTVVAVEEGVALGSVVGAPVGVLAGVDVGSFPVGVLVGTAGVVVDVLVGVLVGVPADVGVDVGGTTAVGPPPGPQALSANPAINARSMTTISAPTQKSAISSRVDQSGSPSFHFLGRCVFCAISLFSSVSKVSLPVP